MTDMTTTAAEPVTLSAFAREFDISPAELLAVLADAIVVVPNIAEPLIEAHQAAKAAAAEAAQRRQAALTAAVAAQVGPLHRRIAARAERQRAMLRQHPELNAFQVAALDAGDPDDQLSRAGRQFDELLSAAKAGVAGYMNHFNPQQKG